MFEILPAISDKATKTILAEVRTWNIQQMSDKELIDLKRMFNEKIRGWITYYGKYYPTALCRVFRHLNRRLVRWGQRKYKRFKTHQGRTWHWLRRLARSQPGLFAHWAKGMMP